MTSPLVVRDLGRLSYEAALAEQHRVRAAVAAGETPDTLLLVEHAPVVTLGRRGEREGILAPEQLEQLGVAVVRSDRGGNVTYHGPGQLVAYPILDLRRYRQDVRWYVTTLEEVVRDVLITYGIGSHCDPAMRGVFTERGKIASLGVHLSRWVTAHGIALNVDPEMAHWAAIAPCGQPDVRAAAIAQFIAPPPPMAEVRERFITAFVERFGCAVVADRAAPVR